jgi:dynein heavy chain
MAQTDKLLHDNEQQRKIVDVGPASELEFWRKRMGRLNSLSEQLKNKYCKVRCADRCLHLPNVGLA